MSGVFEQNPFYVLGLATGATALEAERQGQKLLGMLELGVAASRTYATPLGPRELNTDLVRQAMADLRDPDRRVIFEALAGLPATDATAAPTAPPAWEGALAAFGWRRPSSP